MRFNNSPVNKPSNPSFADRLKGISIRWWLLLGAFVLLWRLDYAPYWNPDEGRYAAASLEMARPFTGSPDWVVPHLNSIPRLNKPPLVYWVAATSFNIFGFNEFASRLGPALAALGIMLLLWRLGRRMFDEVSGICAALVWSSAAFSFAMARVLNTDMLLSAGMTLAYGGMWLALEGAAEDDARPRFSWAYVVAGLGLGLGILAKGPIAVALPLFSGFLYLCIARRWKRVWWPGFVGAVVLAVLIAAPWFFAMEKQRPGFTLKFLLGENVNRLTGKTEFHDPTPPWFYLVLILPLLLPWSAFLTPACRRNGGGEVPATWRGRLFLALWVVVIVAVFSISKTKLVSYILPAFPALALLIGEGIGFIARSERPLLIWRRTILVFTLLLNALLLAALTYYLTNNKTIDRAEAWPYLAGFGLSSLASCTVALLYWKNQMWKWFCGHSIATVGLLLTLVSFTGRLALYEDASTMIKALSPFMQKDDVLVEYRTFQPAAIFYANRPLYIYNFENNSGFEESHPNYKKIFATQTEMTNILKNAERWYLLAKLVHPKAHTHFGKTFMLARNNDFVLLSNKPAPEGFAYYHVSPEHRNMEDIPVAD